MATLTTAGWHRRFMQQARWTRELRDYLYQQADLAGARRILDVGCGTGVLEVELAASTPALIHAIDLDAARLSLARRNSPRTLYTRADALCLPYPDGVFDLALCHFLLLWVSDPIQAAVEMKRVTRPAGFVLALAEPDYGGRIDYPDELAGLGKLQQQALQRQGADPRIGRRLGEIIARAGIHPLETGILGGRWSGPPSEADWSAEWQVLQADLEGQVSPAELDRLRALDRAAWKNGSRVLFVPTFYAIGRV